MPPNVEADPDHGSPLRPNIQAPLLEHDKPALDVALVHAIAWTGGMTIAIQGLSWIVTFVVVRLLHPFDYGIMGMAAVYITLVEVISHLGLGAAIIQNRSLSEDRIAELGALGAGVGIVLT